jgi:hypothetical protein
MRRITVLAIPAALVLLAFLAAPAAAQKAAKPKTATADGTVKSVSATALTVTDKANKDWNFTIDGTTNVVAKGGTTKSAAKGGKVAITDLVSTGDKVTVTYHDMGGTMHAARVRVTSKGTVK